MKYCIQHKVGHGKNAGSKAVRDVRDILSQIGYEPLNIYNRFYHYVWSILKLYLKLRRDDEVVLQWPFYFVPTGAIVKILNAKHVRLILLLHDLNSLRNEKVSVDEKFLLEFAEKIIVHTDAMKRILVKEGVFEKKIVVLTSFDYLTEDSIPTREYSESIVFAGNLAKSEFLNHIPLNSFGLIFNCYGLPKGVIPPYLVYKGAFTPENVSIIEGSWGLVWDGEAIETCSGIKGEYLKINSPHKVSLYIVAGLPVIVWDQSALADYIVNNNLGITVSSIAEIKDAINKISIQRYEEMISAVRKEANKLKRGEHLKSVLQLNL